MTTPTPSKRSCKHCGGPLEKWVNDRHKKAGGFWRCDPCWKAYWKARNQTPERKAYMKAYQQTPERKAYWKARNQTPEYKAYMKAYMQDYNFNYQLGPVLDRRIAAKEQQVEDLEAQLQKLAEFIGEDALKEALNEATR